MKLRSLFHLASFLAVLSSCSKDKGAANDLSLNTEVKIEVTSNGNIITRNEVITHPQGFPYKVDEFKVYVSKFVFTNENGDPVGLQFEKRPGAEQGVFLYWLGKNESFKGFLPEGRYTKVSFNLGLDPAINNLNPNQFDREHPLSRNTDMFWDMLKYRFLVLDGFADINRNSNFDFIYTYHLGGDAFLRTVSIDLDMTVEAAGSITLPLRFNIDRIFANGEDVIDMNTFFSFHSQTVGMETGLKMMDFLAASVEQ
jgi:hypothetical protein